MSLHVKNGGDRMPPILAAGIDTVELVADRPVPWPDWLASKARELADTPDGDPFVDHVDELGEVHTLEVTPGACRQGYARVKARDWAVTIPGERSYKRVRLELRAEALWCLGPENAVGSYAALLHSLLGGAFEWRVSRADLCADVHARFTRDDAERWRRCATSLSEHSSCSPKSKKKILQAEDRELFESYMRHSTFTGWRFGCGAAILARVYLKSLQARTHAPWIAGIWEKDDRYDPNEPVWRVEFQLRRPALERFRIDTLDELFSTRAMDAWRYCTDHWLWLSRSTERSHDKTADMEPWWRYLERAFSPSYLQRVSRGIRLEKERSSLEKMIPQARGLFSGILARLEREQGSPISERQALRILHRQLVRHEDFSRSLYRARRRLDTIDSPSVG